MRSFFCVVTIATATTAWAADLSTGAVDRINNAATALREIHAIPDKDIPQELWEKAACVMVVPNLKKAAFIFGGEFGKGLMSCRQGGGWSAPIFMELQKGSWGLQIGAQSVDLVMLVMNQNGVNKLLKNKVSLGADASVAAGPVGRTAHASTDAQLQSEILSWSRAQGLFAGIDLSGGVLKPDTNDNAELYGQNVSPEEVVAGRVQAPARMQPFMDALKR
ncbi:MAG TPA: lipid-binding SYLF domain-containing protein [Vicinamibacterales bacterium]|nr:lipid-binding SYLF domain-containing protein [Vicinamibacterales bacterium]